MKPLKLIKYGHDQCQPCINMKPILAEIAQEFLDVMDFFDIDTNTIGSEEAKNVGLRAVPLIILTKNNLEVWRHVGAIDKNSLREVVVSHITKWM
jgi:thiol-disulfide isomerase/thioredoxin